MPPICILIGAHIIRISIDTGDNTPSGIVCVTYMEFLTTWSNNCLQHVSCPSTWNILRHYADLTDAQINNLENTIDSPSNGMLLEIAMHQEFNKFSWFFESTVCLPFIVLWK
jgi:hypothetical protein